MVVLVLATVEGYRSKVRPRNCVLQLLLLLSHFSRVRLTEIENGAGEENDNGIELD